MIKVNYTILGNIPSLHFFSVTHTVCFPLTHTVLRGTGGSPGPAPLQATLEGTQFSASSNSDIWACSLHVIEAEKELKDHVLALKFFVLNVAFSLRVIRVDPLLCKGLGNAVRHMDIHGVVNVLSITPYQCHFSVTAKAIRVCVP